MAEKVFCPKCRNYHPPGEKCPENGSRLICEICAGNHETKYCPNAVRCGSCGTLIEKPETLCEKCKENLKEAAS